MAWTMQHRATYELTRYSADIVLPLVFQPSFRLIVKAEIITGLSSRERSLGNLGELLQVEGLGDIRGTLFSLSPGAQLFIPDTEFPFELVYQPIARHFSFELSIWVDTMPIYNDSVSVQPAVSTVATPTTVASQNTSTAILAANPARKGATIWNASTAILYLDLDAAATATDYAARLQPGGYYEVPYGFTGAISGIWSFANGNALVREFT